MTTKQAMITRRRTLAGAATVGIGLSVLSACSDDSARSKAADESSGPPSSKPGETSAASGTTSSVPAGDGIPTSDVPVGGGIVLTDPQVVITQPAKAEFHAFTSICTHAGCPVARVTDAIECDCHGSRYSIEDGSVLSGPAVAPLAAVDLTVARGRIELG